MSDKDPMETSFELGDRDKRRPDLDFMYPTAI